MARFTILLLTVAATITGQKAITSLIHQRTSDEDEDCSSNTCADASQVIAQNMPACESKEATEQAPSCSDRKSCGPAGIGEEQLGQMLQYLNKYLGRCFKPKTLFFVGESVLNAVGVSLEPTWQELLSSAMGWEETLFCV